MDIKKLTDEISVVAQIAPEDVAEAATRGFKSIISNRPDGEAPGQPDFAAISARAASAGLEARYIPIVPGRLTPGDVAAFSDALDKLPKPILAYCRSGTRSTTVWGLAETGCRPAGEILSIAASAGYDLSGVIPKS